ncbi:MULTISPECIES: patatin-like phospholipase family protein [Rhodococcus]|uniref:Patatin-like phospholipase family protein n=1 Tax=Rhodococcus oxybenzonivorans TaxID=1990687 RepID=A0AAE4UYN9_9NOCA|nr:MULTISPECIES: patatin-like phospholipase family protein [Rhodococcus]MDV7241671.1 patatin-like phospholipase family protein [Rhodococcus oxybenzonivorans]MDV7264719.1 patatin-like phospholipase family protein [Rhodococcus oxybenzonivorans]MDV7273796.1 patatin-like phospholipase family protein [Rhodococcus oxybenzonivorans]MDV7333952.1 patatin-like phospholipase family protein [Rhodococcus oxybenzonivorans]MDV7343371.1 patatin-like phospholipase family protein [Rhodococcus oxybenzonivorans]
MTRTGLAIGCGGTLGHAWSVQALATVQDALGWDARDAEVIIGTSAGAEIAVALGAGVPVWELLDSLYGSTDVRPELLAHRAARVRRLPPRPSPRLPATGLVRAGLRRRSVCTAVAGLLPSGRDDASWLRSFGDSLADDSSWVAHPNLWLVAVDAASGDRVPFGAPGSPPARLGDALAASWAIPGWFPPVPIGGRRYVDGGAVSSVSADLLAPLGLDRVVVIAPMTSATPVPGRGAERIERLLRRQMTTGLDREIARLRATGVTVRRIEPGPDELAAMGPNLMDARRRARTLAASRVALPDRVAAALAPSTTTSTRRGPS